MSFILDALQKADRERQAHSSTPTPPPPDPSHSAWLARNPPHPPTASHPLRRWLIILMILTAIPATLWMLLWSGRQHPPPTPSPLIPDAPLQNKAVPPPSTTAHAHDLSTTTNDEIPSPRRAPSPHKPAPITAPDTPAQPPAPPAQPPAPKTSSPSPTQPHPAAASIATQDDMAPSLEQLPAHLRNQLPNLQITAHAYSRRPGASYVFINDQLLHEGESLANGLQLERITAHGMIFSYQGYRFWRNLAP